MFREDLLRIIGVNGINTHGDSNIDLVLEGLEDLGWDIRDVNLPKRHTISAYWGAEGDSDLIVRDSEPGDILVAHSFGCLRAAYAAQKQDYAAMFLIAPAMSRDYQFSRPKSVYCFCSADDWVVTLGSWIPFHPFGKAGTKGFDQLWAYGQNFFLPSDHNDYFSEPYLGDLVSRIHTFAGLHVRAGTN